MKKVDSGGRYVMKDGKHYWVDNFGIEKEMAVYQEKKSGALKIFEVGMPERNWRVLVQE